MPDPVVMSSPPREELKISARSNASQRIIAGGIVIAFCYWAASVVMTVLLSILLSYFLDPLVEWLERFRVPRVAGSLVAVIICLAVVIGMGYLVWERVDRFAEDWPKYRAPLKEAASELERRIQKVEKGVSDLTPAEQARPAVRVEEGRPVRNLLLTWLGGLYTVLLSVAFVPFLVFFMLAAKRDMWHATMQLFSPTERTRVKTTLEDVSSMLRSYVAGNVLVTSILVVCSWIFFLAIGLEYALLTGLVSGVLNMIPYLGAVLALLPPVIIGLTKYNSIGPFLGIAGVLGFFHLIAGNVLIPQMVGKKVHLNALAVTVALLFWGWMWGAIGFILAIPITATIKVICDRVERWQPIGRWLGA